MLVYWTEWFKDMRSRVTTDLSHRKPGGDVIVVTCERWLVPYTSHFNPSRTDGQGEYLRLHDSSILGCRLLIYRMKMHLSGYSFPFCAIISIAIEVRLEFILSRCRTIGTHQPTQLILHVFVHMLIP